MSEADKRKAAGLMAPVEPRGRPAARIECGGGMRTTRVAIGVLIGCSLPFAASAQSAPNSAATSAPTSTPNAAQPANGANAGTTVRSVTVTAGRQDRVRTIDRKVYRTGADLQSTSGSASDLLKNLPSVEVDTDGAVTLRGDGNVQILIDGKPSTQMSGSNRAAALEELPADQIDRIEVIDNPPASYKADGSAGVINIVLKKATRPGRWGSITASVGDEGRKTFSVNGSQKQGRLTLYGGLSIRHDVRKRLFHDRRASIDATTGLASGESRQDGVNETRRLSPTLSGGADFEATKRDKLSASFSYNNRTGTPTSHERDAAWDPTGAAVTAYARDSLGKEHEVNSDYMLKWRHAFSNDGHEIELDLHQSESDEHQRRTYTDVFSVPARPDQVEPMRLHGDELTRELTLDYTRPLRDGAELKAGYDLQRDDDDYDNHDWFAGAGGALTVNPALTDHFHYGQTIHALYGELSRSFGKLAVQGGLRLEQVYITGEELTTNQINRLSYFRAHPSVHLQYELSGAQTLRASYSHRIVRPDPEDLNPYPVYSDAFDYRAGNPKLMPQETHSLEAGWQWRRRGTSLEATAYWRQTRDAITDVSMYITPTVLLTTKENLGHIETGGAELVGDGKLTKSLSWSLSSNLFYSEINASNLGFSQARSAFSYGQKASLDWAVTKADTVQVTGSAWGKRLTAQGYRLPSGTVNFGWRHGFSPKLAMTATVSDAFNTQRDRNIIDLPTLHDSFVRRQLGRVVYIGVTRRFGAGAKKAPDKFEYSE